MKNCTYTYEGKPYSYEGLMEVLRENPTIVNDILYSLDINEQKRVLDKIESIQESNKRLGINRTGGLYSPEFSESADIMSGASDIKVSSDNYTTQTFIDSGMYVDVQGSPYIPVYNIKEYAAKVFDYLKESMGEEQAKANTKFLLDNYKRIAEDARDFHRIMLKMYKDQTMKQLEGLIKGTSFDHLADILKIGTSDKKSVFEDIYSQVYYNNGKHSKELNDTSETKVLKNIKISADIIGKSSKIFANIDFMAVKPDGSLEIFLIKSSHEPHSNWDRAKKEKYEHQMALIAKILEFNGISTKNIRFNIIPVIFKYDDQHKDLIDVKVQRAECYSHRNGAFVLQEAFKAASRFIDSNIEDIIINSETLDKVNLQLNSFIPDGNVKSSGVEETINEYIERNWHRWIQCEQPESGYNFIIDNKYYHVESNKIGKDNKELVELIKKEKLNEKQHYNAASIIADLKDARRVGFCSLGDSYLDDFFMKYFNERSEHIVGDKVHYIYDWKIVENQDAINCNLLIFQNIHTHQIDVISLSELNLKKTNIRHGQKNILNYHLDDIDAYTNQGQVLLNATYGNIETIRVMFLMNELIPQLENNVKLGNVSIIGGLGTSIHGQTNSFQLVMPHFTKICNVLKSIDSNLDLENRFSAVEYISPVDLLIEQYNSIMHENPSLNREEFSELKKIISGSDTDRMIHDLNGEVRSSLQTAENTEVKIERLQELINSLQKFLKSKIKDISPENILRARNHNNLNIRSLANLLTSALITLDKLQGNIRIVQEDLNFFDEYAIRPQDMSNSQIRLISKLLQDAVHSTASRLDTEVGDFINDCLEFYKEMGYSKTENLFIGSQARIFKNLFQDIEKDLIFKNPYSPTAQLNNAERKFLKKVLMHFNKIRHGWKNPKSEEEMATLIEQDPSMLWVPLEKASKSTRRTKAWQNPIEYAKELKDRISDYCKDPMHYFREMYEGILSEEEQETINSDIRDLQAYNAFRPSETAKGRDRLMERGKDFFETNIQNLLIDYAHRHIQEQEMNKMLIKTKGILLYLKIKGIDDNNATEFNKQVKHIEDYLKTSVYGTSIMTPLGKKAESYISPLRKAVTKSYIMLNPIAAVRDTISGFRSNMIRSLTKYRTDIDTKDVLWAYQYVLRNGSMSTMTINFLDKLNAKYLISNINVEQQQEGYKTNREGLFTGNWAFWTLKKPDFLNRMVLFMAKLKHDGSYEAYKIDTDGKLKYDWTLDKRFSLLASKDKSNIEEYNKQKTLYLSQLIAYNKENPHAQLKVSLDTDLPEGYTLNQIEEIKHLGNTIYGAYSNSEKAKYEHIFLGHQFLVFSTWMNGIWDVYFGKRRESSYETEKIQAQDEQGNKLYIDSNGNITKEITDTPYLVDIPLVVQGVFQTFKDLGGILLFKDNKIESLKKFWGNKVQRRNIWRSLSDLLICLLLKQLLMSALDENYKDHKKTSDGDDFVSNAIIEILYKGYGSSFEEFRGPFPIMDYVINNTKPAAFQWNQKFINDTSKFLFGDKTFGDYVIGMQALPRSMQDSYRMWVRDSKKNSDTN